MSTDLAHKFLDKGGVCYAVCQEAFEWWNSSIFWCQNGYNIGRSRMSDPLLRKQTEDMCQIMATSNYSLQKDEDLNNLDDLRIQTLIHKQIPTKLIQSF